MADNVQEFTDANFETDVLQSDQPVLVDFWAPWCGPCKALAPTIEEVASEMAGTVRVGKINIDDNPASAVKYGTNSIPTVLLFKGGEVVERAVGLGPKDKYLSMINAHTG